MPLVCETLTKRGDCLSEASSPVSPLCQETFLTVNPHSLILQIVPQISGWTQALPDMVVSHFFAKVSPVPSLLSVCLCAAWHTGERDQQDTDRQCHMLLPPRSVIMLVHNQIVSSALRLESNLIE